MAHPALRKAEVTQVALELLHRAQPSQRDRRPVGDARTQAGRSRLAGDLGQPEEECGSPDLGLADGALDVRGSHPVELRGALARPEVVQIVKVGPDHHRRSQPGHDRQHRLEKVGLAEEAPVGGVRKVSRIIELPSLDLEMSDAVAGDELPDKIELVPGKRERDAGDGEGGLAQLLAGNHSEQSRIHTPRQRDDHRAGLPKPAGQPLHSCLRSVHTGHANRHGHQPRIGPKTSSGSCTTPV